MLNRRRFLTAGIAASAVPSLITSSTLAQTNPARTLRIVKRNIEVNGKSATVFGLLGPDGRPGLSFAAGERFAVQLVNESNEPTIIHWHGLTPPWHQDGVADNPLPLLASGATRDFDFPLQKSGTNWMHAHTLQEQNLLAAPLIIKERGGASDEQEIVVLLHDFSFKPPEELLAELMQADGGHGTSPQPGTGAMDHSGHGGAGSMIMDLNDIEYDAYLANDRTLNDPETIRVEKGGRVRLRLINGATATVFTLDLGALQGELVAVDGIPVRSVRGRRFPFAMGQRLDIRLALPSGAHSFPILFLREAARERTGVILATADASVPKVAPLADEAGPIMDIGLEAALRAVSPLAARPVGQTAAVGLVGEMAKYRWGLAGLEKPLILRTGVRVEVTMANRSMMAHPMHLHGHHFQVVAVNGRRISGAMRDTVQLPPKNNITIAFDADNPGKWAFHCHHLYHMAAGMMGFFHYEEIG